MKAELHETLTLEQSCPALTIPDGEPVTLEPGTLVRITQVAGGDLSLMTDRGRMVRVAGRHAPTLGVDPPDDPLAEIVGRAGPTDTERVRDVLRTLHDPEIPVNLVDLGLIYRVDVHPDGEPGDKRVTVAMTLTAPGCGMGDVLVRDVEERVGRLPDVARVEVELVFDPPWTPDRMSAAARLELGLG